MFGSSPLNTAAAFVRTQVAEALIEAGANMNIRNNEGSTPLHAAFLCHTQIVKFMLEKGANKYLRNYNGHTALDLVAGSFDDVKDGYDGIGKALAPLGFVLDYEHIKVTRPKIASMLQPQPQELEAAQLPTLYGLLVIKNDHLGCKGIFVTARDMAKFGLLYLYHGEYEGNRVLPAAWVRESLQTYSERIHDNKLGLYLRDIGYGYQWWSARVGDHHLSFARGHGGQLIVLLYERDMIIVTTADPLETPELAAEGGGNTKGGSSSLWVSSSNPCRRNDGQAGPAGLGFLSGANDFDGLYGLIVASASHFEPAEVSAARYLGSIE